MTTLKTLINRHPVWTYFVLTFAISWGGLAIVAGPGGITAEQTDLPFMLVYLTTVAGPPIASLLLIGLFYGRTGLRELWSGLLKWQVGARWYAVALLVAPLSLMVTLFVLSLTSPEFIPGIIATNNPADPLLFGFRNSEKTFLVLFVFLFGLFNGFMEELGWTGFAIPRLTTRYGVLTTGLSVGFLWGAWHFLSNYLGSASATGGVPLFLYISALLFTFLPPYRVLMVWVYEHTRSLPLAMLMHANLNFFWLLSMPAGITGMQVVIWYLAWAAVLWIGVAAVAVANHREFSWRSVRSPVA